MPENTLRCSSPISRVRRSSLSAPSTASALTIKATRRSTAAKVSNSISAAKGSLSSSPLPVGALAWLAVRSSLEASTMASTLTGSMRVIRALNGFSLWLANRVL
ncbi:hypothetical protein D3C80_1629110 [compost metagenome]